MIPQSLQLSTLLFQDGRVLKLSGFSIAGEVGNIQELPDSPLVGLLLYMAPEVIKGGDSLASHSTVEQGF